MKSIQDLSIRYKITLGFLVVMCIFIAQGFGSKNSINLLYETFHVVSNESQPAVEKAGLLNAQIEAVFGAMGIYLLTGDADQEQEFVVGLNRISISIKLLKKLKAIAADQTSLDLLNDIEANVNDIQKIKPRLLELSKNDNLNIKAVGFASENINPLYRDMMQLLSQMITSEDEEEYIDERKELLALFNTLRYNWSNVMSEMRLFLAFKVDAAVDNVALYSSTVDTLVARIQTLQDEEDILTLDQLDSLEQFNVLKQQFGTNFAQLVEIHRSDSWRQDSYIIKTEVTPLLINIKQKIDALTYRQKENISTAQTQVDEIFEKQSTQFYIVLGIALFFAFVIAWFLSRIITTSLNAAVHLAEQISQGNLDNVVEVKCHDETGLLLTALKNMQNNLSESLETERVISRENARVKTALDNISGNVIVIDNKDKLVYINNKAQSLYQDMSGVTLEAGAKSNDLNSSIFLSNSEPCDKEVVNTNSYSLLVTSNKIIADDGELLGKVFEIDDKTLELAMENEIAEVVSLAMVGDLAKKIDLNNKTGFFAMLSSNTNELLAVVENALNSLNCSMQTLAKGDLTQDVDQVNVGIFGEVEHAAHQTVTQLREITKKIISSARVIDEISTEIAAGNGNLSSRSEQQAAALEQTAASIDELTSTVEQNSSNSQQASDLALSAQAIASQGGGVINDAIDAMQQINESSTKIADIIGVIDEIAFQTNLLALNASVEAARAGDQGRGFAVVATEVRNLAQRSATAAKEIKELINDSVNKVQAGSQLVNESGKSLEEIESGVKKVVDIISEIATASEEQSKGIREVNIAITSMDTLTQQNAALAEEVTAASINLSERSSIMQKDVSFFKINPDNQTQNNSVHFNEVMVFDDDEDDFPTSTDSAPASVEQNDTQISSDEWDEF